MFLFEPVFKCQYSSQYVQDNITYISTVIYHLKCPCSFFVLDTCVLSDKCYGFSTVRYIYSVLWGVLSLSRYQRACVSYLLLNVSIKTHRVAGLQLHNAYFDLFCVFFYNKNMTDKALHLLHTGPESLLTIQSNFANSNIGFLNIG